MYHNGGYVFMGSINGKDPKDPSFLATDRWRLMPFRFQEFFMKVNLTSSLKEFNTEALLNWSNCSCKCRGSPLYCDSFYSSSGSLFLLVFASRNIFVKSAEFKARAESGGCCCPFKYNGFATGQSIRWTKY